MSTAGDIPNKPPSQGKKYEKKGREKRQILDTNHGGDSWSKIVSVPGGHVRKVEIIAAPEEVEPAILNYRSQIR